MVETANCVLYVLVELALAIMQEPIPHAEPVRIWVMILEWQ